MSDFRVELNISANDNGTYCYCESQKDLADDSDNVDVLDFSEGDFWDVIQEKIRNFVANDEQFVKACNILDKEGKLILTAEY